MPMQFPTIREAMTSGQTLVFGHRGAMADAPMNTLAAFALAHEQGAQGIELDTQLSKDGQPIVLHDFTVDATTDGRGAAADFTLAELRRLDAGSWFSPEFAGERIPALDEVLAAFGGKLFINIEVKSRMTSPDALSQAVATCIERHGQLDRVIVSSFDWSLLRRFRALCPQVMIGCLYYKGNVARPPDELAAEALHPWHDLVDAASMERARTGGLFVNAWTINDGRRACQLQRLGVNGIITDTPGEILTALERC